MAFVRLAIPKGKEKPRNKKSGVIFSAWAITGMHLYIQGVL